VRQQIRATYGIDGGVVGDCLVSEIILLFYRIVIIYHSILELNIIYDPFIFFFFLVRLMVELFGK
jgi:hypothetical protein